MKLKKGDIFCTTNRRWLSKNAGSGSSSWTAHGKIKYSRAGIIISDDGEALEALNNGVKRHNFYQAYKGSQVLIARLLHACPSKINPAIDTIIEECERGIYPRWPMARHFSKSKVANPLVGSELVSKYLALTEEGDANYLGVTPGILADRIINYKNYYVIFEGKLP